MPASRAIRAQGLILLAYLCLALLVLSALPPFESSDEAEHFLYAHSIALSGELPVLTTRGAVTGDLPPSVRWNNHAHHPPLYYLLAAWLIAWTDRSQIDELLRPNELIFIAAGDISAQHNKWLHAPTPPSDQTLLALHLLRAFNLLLGSLTLLLIQRAALRLSGRRAVALLAMALVACLPTFLVLSVSVTNDMLLTMLGALAFERGLAALQSRRLSWRAALLLGALAGAALLTKLNGISIAASLALVWLILVLRRQLPLRRALLLGAGMAAVALLIAGGFFLRNLQLYGDPLAQDAVAAMWGRALDPISDPAPLDQLSRIARSFWMMAGYLHAPVYAPPAFYAWAAALSLLGLAGLLRAARRLPRDLLFFALASCGLALFALFYGTRAVDISYGRLLYPALAPFAALLAFGLHALLRRWAALALVPLALGALWIAFIELPQAYPRLTAVPELPAAAVATIYDAEGLIIEGLELDSSQPLQPGTALHAWLYLRGAHPTNPMLQAALIDDASGQRLAYSEFFPGMAPTDDLPPGLWRAPLRLFLAAPDEILAPRRLRLELRWHSLADATSPAPSDPDAPRVLALPAGVWNDPRYAAPTLAQSSTARFGPIELLGWQLDAPAAPDAPHLLRLVWRSRERLPDDWTTAIHLLDSSGALIAQFDAMPAHYPTSAWLPNLAFEDQRLIPLPAGLDPAALRLRLAWYRLPDGARLPLSGAPGTDDFLELLP